MELEFHLFVLLITIHYYYCCLLSLRSTIEKLLAGCFPLDVYLVVLVWPRSKHHSITLELSIFCYSYFHAYKLSSAYDWKLRWIPPKATYNPISKLRPLHPHGHVHKIWVDSPLQLTTGNCNAPLPPPISLSYL